MEKMKKIETKNDFKETKIGLIPEDWEVVDSKNILFFQEGPGIRSFEYSSKGCHIINVRCVRRNYIDLNNAKFVSWNLVQKKWNHFLVKEGDILVTTSGTIGRVTRVKKENLPLLMNTSVVRFRSLDKEKLDNNYLQYYLQSSFFFTQLYNQHTGAVIKNVGPSHIKRTKVILPSFSEQRKIARVLSKIQQAIEQQDKIIEATKNLKKSLMQKIFTEGVINGFMFDTMIFNKILDAEISLDSLPKNFKYVVTHIQCGELKKTPNKDRRKKLLDIFFKIDSEEIFTESTLLGTSILGKSKLSNNLLCEEIKLMLDKKQNKESNKNDALIAETTIKNGLILVTDDSDLLEVTQRYNGEVITLEDFLSGNYRKFKQTKVGQIPQIWKVVKIENVINEITSGDWGIDEKENKDGFLKCQVIRGTDFLNLEKRIFSGIPRRLIKESSFKKRELKSGDLLIEISGGSKKQPTGRVFHINNYLLEKSSLPLLFTNFVKLIRVKEETLLSEYLWHYWQYLYDKGITRIYEKRTTGIRNFKYKDFLSNEIISVPSFYEQQQIVNIMNTVDKKIELEESMKSILKELFKTMLHKLMTGEIRLKDINI